MPRHVWEIDVSTDFDANAVELEAVRAGPEAVAELSMIYEQKLEAYFAAISPGHPARENKRSIIERFADWNRLAQAAYLLPRKSIDSDDFEAMPIYQPGSGQRMPAGWCRTNNGGVWIAMGPNLLRDFMIYRVAIVGAPDLSRN